MDYETLRSPNYFAGWTVWLKTRGRVPEINLLLEFRKLGNIQPTDEPWGKTGNDDLEDRRAITCLSFSSLAMVPMVHDRHRDLG